MSHEDPEKIKKATSANARLIMTVGLVFVLSVIMVIVLLNWRMKAHALDEAGQKAKIMLDRNLTVHTYFTHQLKPVLFQTLSSAETTGREADFQPVWMSSTYAVREIEKYFQSLTEAGYYYKECASNARHPENEADAFEKTFIEKLNRFPDLNFYTLVRVIEGEPQLQVFRRGEIKEVKTLQGILPICASCKKIRDDQGYWSQVDTYIHEHSGTEFSHGICPDCAKKLYPEFVKEEDP